MKASALYGFLDTIAPFAGAMDFDNPGLLIGDKDCAVDRILLSLDCTIPAVRRAKEIGAQVILTHHPVIFEPLKKVTADSVVWALAQSGITVISAHTNLDFAAGGVCDTLCALAGLTQVTAAESGLRIGQTQPLSPRAFAARIQQALRAPVRFTEGREPVRRVAVCSGSGGSFLAEAAACRCDTLLTGDVKYSAFLAAAEWGITLLDAGHFETEQIILPVLQKRLAEAFPDVKTEIFNCNPIQRL